MKAKIDAHLALTVTCPPGKARIMIWDTHLGGFCLSVAKSGTKTFAIKFTTKNGVQREYKLGRYPDITADRARKEAAKVKARVTVGEDPAGERNEMRRTPTLNDVAKRYLEHVESRKKSWDVDERVLRVHVLPRFGRMRMDEIKQADVVSWLRSKATNGFAPSYVNRFQIIINLTYKLAHRWGIPGCAVSPLHGVAQLKVNNEKERFLTAEEIERLKAACERSDNPQLANIVALLLLTGARKRELLDAKWEDFDLGRRQWRIPMSKSGKARHVPLSTAAIDVLRGLPRWDRCPFVVPNPKTMKPFDHFHRSWDTARKEAGLADVRIHDLRHTAASHLVNAGHSLYVVSKVLGHAQQSTTQRYAHLSQDTLLAAVDAAAGGMGAWTKADDQAA
jgi:integrase